MCNCPSSALICTLNFASRLERGSSIKNASGFLTIALPIATRCLWPPDKAFGFLSKSSLISSVLAASYEKDIDSLCIGPSWEGFGPGEVSINLEKNKNFTNSITGLINKKNSDGCNNYYYYLRFLTVNLQNGENILIGVATDYAKNYPDAPYVWLQNKNNQIEELGSTKIEKYSLNFELSR